MSVIIKSLTTAVTAADESMDAMQNIFNVIGESGQTANLIWDLYEAPSSAIIKSVRLANTHTAQVQITLFFNRPTAGEARRVRLTPADMVLDTNVVYLDDTEITMEAGDKIQAKVSVAGKVQYLLSGVERETV